MTITTVPTRTELVGRAADLVDQIRAHAQWQDENRILHEEVLGAVADSGLLKMRVPLRYGGYESDVRTVSEVVAELGRGDGSTGWSIGTMTLACTQIGLFPDDVQDEVFANPDVRVCGTVTPSGIATPAKGGVVLNGEWRFNTGAPLAQWDVLASLLATEDGGYVPAAILVPITDVTLVDDWHTAGLRATSSVRVVVRDLFVPDDRVLPFLPVLINSQHRSERNADSAAWKVPFVAWSATIACSPALGMAQAAQELFLERLPDRKITYTDYEHQNEAPLTHLQVAESAMKIDEAAFHLRRAAERIDTSVKAGQPFTLQEKALTRLDASTVCLRAKEAVEVLATASGGSSLYYDVPIQRIHRDVHAINLNGVVHPSTNAETYGRILCGLEPNTNLL